MKLSSVYEEILRSVTSANGVHLELILTVKLHSYLSATVLKSTWFVYSRIVWKANRKSVFVTVFREMRKALCFFRELWNKIKFVLTDTSDTCIIPVTETGTWRTGEFMTFPPLRPCNVQCSVVDEMMQMPELDWFNYIVLALFAFYQWFQRFSFDIVFYSDVKRWHFFNIVWATCIVTEMTGTYTFTCSCIS